MPTPRQRSGPSLCLADCDDNGPPVPIQQQVQLLALDDKAVKNKMKQDAKAKEQKSVMSFVDEEGANCAPIPVQQQMHQFDDAKEKTTLEISTANGERDSTTELTAEEMEEGEVNLRPRRPFGAERRNTDLRWRRCAHGVDSASNRGVHGVDSALNMGVHGVGLPSNMGGTCLEQLETKGIDSCSCHYIGYYCWNCFRGSWVGQSLGLEEGYVKMPRSQHY
ncbi:hypothetical protein THAOC_32929 [Thalassiosira oceanica]|uniref:Uncharacterized protein n=1 Tax=Thalassiosira oceanica TaxID=159749 RepID=K0R501_THAOC|nr:hypothetical protein THAOC_32929 [Thalassiosira oceanica]|eukprot:EJK48293.1 hypothetical protein THAOC_32929 [Thalassiosira oceanica]